MGSKRIWIGAAVLLAASPAVAQRNEPPPIVVSADAPFVHANSGITMPVTLAGYPRTKVREYEAPQLDVGGTWQSGDDAELTVFVYRSTAGSVPVWFDRASVAVETRGTFGTPKLAQPVAAVSAPGASNASGLLAGWTVTSGAYKGTAAAILPMGEWLVKFRYSTTQSDGAAAAAVLRRAIAELGWPASIPAAPEAQPIAACATRMDTAERTKPAPRDMTSALAGALTGLAMSIPTATPAQRWCRDAQTLPIAGIYRPDAATDRYLIALSDAGRGILVAPAFDGIGDGTGAGKRARSWSVDLVTPGSIVQFPAQDRLPSAERVMAVLREQPVSKVSTWGQKRDVTLITPPAR